MDPPQMTASDPPVSDAAPEKGVGGRDSALRDAMLLKISWLRSFLAVAERGGFGAAASKLHLSQSRVSAHIAALEELLGFTLFERRVPLDFR